MPEEQRSGLRRQPAPGSPGTKWQESGGSRAEVEGGDPGCALLHTSQRNEDTIYPPASSQRPFMGGLTLWGGGGGNETRGRMT